MLKRTTDNQNQAFLSPENQIRTAVLMCQRGGKIMEWIPTVNDRMTAEDKKNNKATKGSWFSLKAKSPPEMTSGLNLGKTCISLLDSSRLPHSYYYYFFLSNSVLPQRFMLTFNNLASSCRVSYAPLDVAGGRINETTLMRAQIHARNRVQLMRGFSFIMNAVNKNTKANNICVHLCNQLRI